MTYLYIVLFLLFAFGVPFLIWKKIRGEKLADDDIGIADTDIVVVAFRGEFVTLSNIDYQIKWSAMNRDQKNQIFESQRKAIKKGEAEKVWFESAGEQHYYLRATKKGSQYLNIHKQIHEIYLDEPDSKRSESPKGKDTNKN